MSRREHAVVSITGRVVRVEGGLLQVFTTADRAVETAFGIPYAAPPVDNLRWRAPVAVRPWESIRPADRFGPACIQAGLPRNALLAWAMTTPGPLVMSEDCLYLNVWAPAQAKGAPVLVWIHGGGNRFGSGVQVRASGEGLARRGTVVVSFNYRLSALGFLAHPELTAEAAGAGSGNYALMDTLAVLGWVSRNIETFGGDPNRVTLAGHSVGAAQVAALMTAPSARGYFHRAILQSPMSIFNGQTKMPSLAEAEALGVNFAESLGAKSLHDLRNYPAVELINKPGFGPIVDRATLETDLSASFGAQQQFPLPALVGSNSHEGSPYPQPKTAQEFIAKAQLAYKDEAGEFLKLYPVTTDADVFAAGQASTRDLMVGWQASLFCRLHSQRAPVYRYYFAAQPAFPANSRFRELDRLGAYGAFHGAEIAYVFDSQAGVDAEWTESDRLLASEMADRWSEFVAGGEPTTQERVPWPALGTAPQDVMRFVAPSGSLGVEENSAQLRFLERRFGPAISSETKV